jgi:hypothetical protein
VKRVLLIILFLGLIAAAVTIYFLRTKSGFDSIYLVPENAILVIETKDPMKAWDKIVHSNAWNHYRRNKFFADLDADILSFDSLINSSKFLLKLVGEKPLIISQHPVGNQKYDFLYIIEAGKAADFGNPGKVVSATLGSGYNISTREYKGFKILDILDKVEKEYCFLAFVKGKLVFSWSPKLIEQSIDASEKMLLGRDIDFLNVRSKIYNQGLFTVCLLHKNLKKYISDLSAEARESFESATKGISYSGISFDIDAKGKIDIEGYSGFDGASQTNFSDILSGGSMNIESSEVIPNRIASMVKINFDDAASFIDNSVKVAGEKEYKSYISNVAMVEKHLKINLNDNFYSWIDKEMIFLQTQPSNLGRSNEFAVVIKASDSTLAADNLHLIYRQIRKNSPVKIKTAKYKGYDIDYIAFPGILKILFGKMLKKIEKPYITQLGEDIIISNHPQTNKNIIDDFLAGNTIYNSKPYSDFSGEFSGNTSVWLYVEPIVLYQNLNSMVNAETWLKIQNNKEYITCFDKVGLQVNTSGNMLHFKFKTQYITRIEEWKMPFYNPGEILSMFDYAEPVVEVSTSAKPEKDTIPDIAISDFDAKKYEEFYDDGSLKLSVELKNGLKHGDLKVYYPSGETKISGRFKNDEPVGKWKYYTEDGDTKKVDEY